MTLLMMLSVTLLSMLMMLLSTLLSKCDQVSDLWQQQALASEIQSELRETKN